MADEIAGRLVANLHGTPPSPICPGGSRRTALSPTWSDPEGSSHNDFVPGRRLPPHQLPSAAKQHEEPANAGRRVAAGQPNRQRGFTPRRRTPREKLDPRFRGDDETA